MIYERNLWKFFRIYIFSFTDDERILGLTSPKPHSNMFTGRLVVKGMRKHSVAALQLRRHLQFTMQRKKTLNIQSLSRLSNTRVQHKAFNSEGCSSSSHSHLLEAVGEDLLDEEKEEVNKLTSRFLHTGSMAHQVD